ncbi:MAG: helix-turn-helix transcriptional regulator [Gammaproteobacteria bacterium]|nr:helix-turn-helix transcriptional regulator [Gammaproteobacteria bacterium]
MDTQIKQRPNIRELLALNLKFLRAKRGLSQDALALVSGLDRTFVAHVERLKRNISLDNLEKLAIALDVPVADLLQENLRDAE